MEDQIAHDEIPSFWESGSRFDVHSVQQIAEIPRLIGVSVSARERERERYVQRKFIQA